MRNRFLVALIAAVISLLFGFGCSGSTDDNTNGKNADALIGCVRGADCNVKGAECHINPADLKSPKLFCIIPEGATSGTFQPQCREDSLCESIDGSSSTCKQTFTPPSAGPDMWFVCDLSTNKYVPMSVPDASPDSTDASTDSGSPDSSPTDTGPADTGPADTGPADTGLADTGPADTGPADTGPADTGPADTGPADTGPADTGPADTGLADTGVDSTVVDTGPADTGPADTASADTSSDAGLVCVAPPPILDCKLNAYGCLNPESGMLCTDSTTSPPVLLKCQCPDGSGRGWLLPWGADCTAVPICVAKCDGGTCPDTAPSDTGPTDTGPTDTADATVVDSTTADTADSTVVDSTVLDTADSTVTDTTVADSTSADTADSTSVDAADTSVTDTATDASSDASGFASCAAVPAGELWVFFSTPSPRPTGYAGTLGFGYWIEKPAPGGAVAGWTKPACLAPDTATDKTACKFSPYPGWGVLTTGTKIHFNYGVLKALSDLDFYNWFNAIVAGPDGGSIITRTGITTVCLGTTQIGGRNGATFSGSMAVSSDLGSPQNDMVVVP